jgi:N-terminal domain of (some) glycogen debranching enzymes
MPFKVHVGPRQISIHQGQTVLVSEPDGQIEWPSDQGLYFFDTRLISSWSSYANGEPWDLLNGGAITHYASRIYLTNRRIRTDPTVLDLRLGKRQFDMRFWRADGENHFEVLRGDPKAVVRSPFGGRFEQAALA